MQRLWSFPEQGFKVTGCYRGGTVALTHFARLSSRVADCVRWTAAVSLGEYKWALMHTLSFPHIEASRRVQSDRRKLCRVSPSVGPKSHGPLLHTHFQKKTHITAQTGWIFEKGLGQNWKSHGSGITNTLSASVMNQRADLCVYITVCVFICPVPIYCLSLISTPCSAALSIFQWLILHVSVLITNSVAGKGSRR